MIIDFELKVNTYEEFFSKNCKLDKYHCPKCGCKHLIKHATYPRNFIIIENNFFVDKKFTVLRLLCTSCGSTHAILPNDVIPYCIHSFSLVIDILEERYVNSTSVLKITEKYNISFQLIYSMVGRFIEFFNECKSCLRIIQIQILVEDYKNVLIAVSDYIKLNNNFLKVFLFNFKWCFMMIKFHNTIPPPVWIGIANRAT